MTRHKKALSPTKTKQGFPNVSQANNTAASRQRQVILKHLQQGKRLTTIYAREVLGICHPAARVMELRKHGRNIATNWRTEEDVTGRPHRVAEYVLFHGEVQP